MNMTEILKSAVERGASDIFVVAGLPLTYKVRGEQQRETADGAFTPEKTEAFAAEIYRLRGGEALIAARKESRMPTRARSPLCRATAEEAAELSDADKLALIAKLRTEARKAKDWATADAIRDALAARHIVVKDTRRASRGLCRAKIRK